jgi:WhiB family transcriptional regulator, redox-sensing transcriptional regulator
MLPVAFRAGFLGWMSRGACGGVDPELFFPVKGTAWPAVRQAEAAKAVCGRCAVRARCMSYTLQVMPEVLWGGTTEKERRAERRSWRRRPGWQSGDTEESALAGMASRATARAGRAAGQWVASRRTAQ